MLTAFVLSLVVAGTPVERFTEAQPASQQVATLDGQRLVHASGFLAGATGRGPEAAARAFLRAYGAAFGVTDRQVLLLEAAPSAGQVGAVRFSRMIDGLPVFGGDLVVGVDAHGRVFLVNAADVAPSISGRHRLDEAAALHAAESSFLDGVQGAVPVAVAKGWSTFGTSVRAVYRVDFIAQKPAGDWRVFVDGETGRALFRENLRDYVSAPGTVFEVSPVESAASACPVSGAGHSLCASPIAVTIPNLTTGTDLTGTQTAVFNCKGADAPTTVPGACTPVAAIGGAFNFPADTTFKATSDDFAAPMAYYHLDKHVSFFKRLDPTLPTGTGRAVRASLPGLVNSFQGGAPINNAFYSPLIDAMIFGQGTTVDWAYDATIIYHEFTHGVVSAWGGFNPTIDSLGAQWEPKALNEGTADSMAASETGRSEWGSFISAVGASTASSPGRFLRNLSDPNASRTCQGDGTLVPGLTVVNGLDGEEHDDGEIWNGVYWEVYQGLKSAGIKACNGTCEAGPAIQYKALQLSANTSPTFNSYWQTFKTATSVMFPPASGAAVYVDCVAKRRKLDKCDRTVPLYAGEKKEEVVNFRYSPFQIVINTTGQAQFSICSGAATATTIHARNGSPIQVDPATGTVTADASASFTHQCSAGVQTFTIGSAAGETWYLLLDLGSTAVADLYRIDMGTTGVSSRPASAPIPTCAPPVLTATPATASIAPRGTVAFTATGGSGSGYAWSLPTNASTGAIDASTGAYTAGPNGGVTDVVQVTDSLGNTAKASVSVSAPAPAPSPSPAPSPTPNPSPNSGGGGGGCSTSGAHGVLLSLAALASLLRRRTKRIR